MLIGYARVSTREQNLDTQVSKLEGEGCEKIFTDKISGVATDKPGWKEAVRFAREGDVIVVYAIDRLARSTVGIINTINGLAEKGVGVKSLRESYIDTTSPQGEFFLTIMAGFAQMERNLIRERSKDGIERAKAAGKRLGPKHKLGPAQIAAIQEAFRNGTSVPELADEFGVSRATIYRVKG